MGRPSWSAAATPGDGQVTLHITAAGPTDEVYVIWRGSDGTFTDPDVAFSRVGSGDVVVTGLNNYQGYGFLALADEGAAWSLPTQEEAFASPGTTDAEGQLSLPVHYLRETLAASAAFQGLVGAADAEAAKEAILPVCGYAARGRVTVADGAVSAVAVAGGGRGYRSAPTVTVFSAAGAGAAVTAAVSGGRVTGFTVVTPGSGYADGDCTVEVAGPTLPLAIVDWMPDWGKSQVAGGARNWFEGEGGLLLMFRTTVDPTLTEAEAAFELMNSIGAIVEDLEELAGTAGYLNITAIRKVLGPRRPEESELQTSGDYYEIGFAVSFEGI